MVQQRLSLLNDELQEILSLDLDNFGLECDTQQGELLSRFIGLQLRSHFQPIVDTSHAGEVLGYEALLRSTVGRDALTPDLVFSIAESRDKLIKLDRVARTLHSLNFLSLPDNRGLLFLNVHPHLLTAVNAHGKVFENILHRRCVPTHSVVIEVLEDTLVSEPQLIQAVDNYRQRGFQIAVDDFAANYSALDRLWKLSPNFVKLDLSIIQQAQFDPKVRRILPKLVDMVQASGAKVVIEGIENQVQYQIAVDAGATLLQGYFLGRPAPVAHWNASASTVANSFIGHSGQVECVAKAVVV